MFVEEYRLYPRILIVIFNNTGSLIYLTSATRHVLLLLFHMCVCVCVDDEVGCVNTIH